MFGWIVWRDLILAWRRRADVLASLFFFVIVVSLFPLGIGPEAQLLRTIAPGVVWVAALLACAMAGRGNSPGHHCARTWTSVRSVAKYACGGDSVFVVGHTMPEFDRLDRCCVNSRVAGGQRVNGAARVAAVYSGLDFWRRRGGGQRQRCER